MIEYKVARNLRILFVGINPHPGSFRRGVPFSNNKTFWYLLIRAGLLDEPESELRTDAGLREMYDHHFLPRYRLGFVNLVDRPTVQVTDLRKGEQRPGVERLLEDIRAFRPKVVCFIGKVTCKAFRGGGECDYGWQEDIDGARVYLMHFPIRGPASVRIRELREIKEASRD